MAGRPQKEFDSSFIEQAFRLSLLGVSDIEMSEYFGVSRNTLLRWRKEHSDFDAAIVTGKTEADGKVAMGLYKRAVGTTVTERRTKTVFDESGNESIAEIVETVTEIPPDSKAAMQWLHNRRSKEWRQKIEVPPTINITPIDWSELRKITAEAIKRAQEQHETVISGRYERLCVLKEFQS